MKKRLFFAVLVGVLALGVLGGTVLAQEDGTDGDSSQQEQPKTLLQRVAAILGIDEAQILRTLSNRPPGRRRRVASA